MWFITLVRRTPERFKLKKLKTVRWAAQTCALQDVCDSAGSAARLRFIFGLGDAAGPIARATAVVGNRQDEQAIFFD